MKVRRFRVARPTSQLATVRDFYVEGLGLREIGSFQDHDGYDGVMIAVHGWEAHLEFTQHEDVDGVPAPTSENLLVFYLENADALREAEARLRSRGHVPVSPENPYWEGRSVTFEDPDGWRIVLFDETTLG